MKTYALQRRLAAYILKVGRNRVWLNPLKLKDIGDAITKIDITDLVKEGFIKKLPVVGVKRRAVKLRQLRKKKRGRKAVGRKRRTVNRKKEIYMAKIRKIRAYLLALKKNNKIEGKQYRSFRLAAKAGIINTKQDVRLKLKQNEKKN